MNTKVAKAFKIIKNKFVIATVIFLAIYFFLGENSRQVIHSLQREVNDLRREAMILEHDIKQDSIEALSLFGSADALETYGREHYYMKRADEDIFIIKQLEK